MTDKENPTEPTLPPDSDNSLPLPGESSGKPQITFRGNSIDLSAVSALVAAALVAFSCMTCNVGYYCLPLIPLLLGIFGLVSARESVDESRTRWMSWVGVGVGGGIFALLMIAMIAYLILVIISIAFGLAAEAGSL
jgi:hypothetical protein